VIFTDIFRFFYGNILRENYDCIFFTDNMEGLLLRSLMRTVIQGSGALARQLIVDYKLLVHET